MGRRTGGHKLVMESSHVEAFPFSLRADEGLAEGRNRRERHVGKALTCLASERYSSMIVICERDLQTQDVQSAVSHSRHKEAPHHLRSKNS